VKELCHRLNISVPDRRRQFAILLLIDARNLPRAASDAPLAKIITLLTGVVLAAYFITSGETYSPDCRTGTSAEIEFSEYILIHNSFGGQSFSFGSCWGGRRKLSRDRAVEMDGRNFISLSISSEPRPRLG
jgi:hypothetical protein